MIIVKLERVHSFLDFFKSAILLFDRGLRKFKALPQLRYLLIFLSNQFLILFFRLRNLIDSGMNLSIQLLAVLIEKVHNLILLDLDVYLQLIDETLLFLFVLIVHFLLLVLSL